MLRRRSFLAQLLTAAATAALGGIQSLLRFRPLVRPTTVPLEDLSVPWRARTFAAEGVTLSSAANPNQPIRVSGMIVRISEAAGAGGAAAEQFSAVCVRCPHEGCDVDFVPDPATLPEEVIGEIGKKPTESVYICPCHNSTFAARDGERLAGPAPRGLYRFRVTSVGDTALEIGEVEEDVLIFL